MKKMTMAVALVAAFATGVVGAAYAAFDFGLFRDKELASRSFLLFGVGKTLDASSTASIDAATASANPTALVTVARSLKVRAVTDATDGTAPVIDMMALWPNDTDPEWLIACNEDGTDDPALQRIDIATGATTTILTGTDACDGVRRTPWGTFLFSEEAGGGPAGGRVYELLDPLAVSGVTLDRTTGTFSGGTVESGFAPCPDPPGDASCYFAVRPYLGRLSFEGFAMYANGPVYYGGEDRPLEGQIGGAYFKFIPACAPTGTCPAALTGATPGDALGQSPLAHGTVYGLRLGRRSGNTDYGQGTNYGLGTWVAMGPADTELDLRALSTTTTVLTGFYRPEDIDLDQAAAARGTVRWCANNTGNEAADHLWGEAVCLTDGSIANATTNVGPGPTVAPELQLFIAGNPQLAMMDNMAYQPIRGNWIIHEDGDQLQGNNDLWDCLPDGADADQMSDGCVRIGTLNDLEAEWTGGIFDASGSKFFVSIQHNVSGFGVVLEITGWK